MDKSKISSLKPEWVIEGSDSNINIDEKPPFSDTDLAKKLPRTLREQYLLEKERIKYEVGDLEQIRISLGYSQRRMCQLLLVDPSAWTRWTKTLSGAPPHVYQALRWLVELKKTNPDAVAPSNIAKRVDFVQASTDAQLKELKSEIATLERVVALTPTPSSSNDYAVESILRSHESKWEEKFDLLKAQLETLVKNSKKSSKKPKKKRASAKRSLKRRKAIKKRSTKLQFKKKKTRARRRHR